MAAVAGALILGLPGHAIADGTQTLTVELVAASVTEGPDAKLTFVVKLSEGPDQATFDYAPGGTATAGTDHGLASKAGETIAPGGQLLIDVPVLDDARDEDAETVALNVSAIAGAANATAGASGSIVDDDEPPSVTTIADVDTPENEATVPVTVTLSGPSDKQISVDYRVGEGSTATAGADFRLPSGGLTFAPGETTKSVPVEILEDAAFEATETIFVIFFGHVNVQPGPDLEGRVRIEDDGDAPSAPTVPNVSVAEGNPVDGEPATIDLVFEVSLAGPRAQTTFTYRTIAGSANASDFVEVGGAPVVLPASGAASPPPVPVTIKVRRDALDELDESFVLELVSPDSGAVVAAATGTITNDDDNSALTVGDASANEPTSGTSTLPFTITLAPASERTVGVAWSTGDGTATAGVDYTADSGTVSFAPGETEKTVDVTLLGDGVNEENETVKLVLSAPTGVPPGKLVDAEALGTIVDKNALPSLSISDTTGREGEGVTFTVTLSGTTDRTVTVSFGTADGLAKAGLDYAARVGTLSFAPGERPKSLAVTVTDDAIAESAEDFTMRLGDPINATITKSAGRATIEASDQSTTAQKPVTPPIPPAAKKAPVKVLAPRMILGPATVRVGADGVARMTVTCQRTSPIACRGSIRLERVAKPLLKVGTRVFAVAKGRKGSAPIRLTGRALAILRRQGSMRVRVIVVYRKSVGTGRAVPGVLRLTATKSTPAAAPRP